MSQSEITKTMQWALCVTIMLGIWAPVAAIVRDGQVDPSFSIMPISFALGGRKINDLIQLSDGKILVGGDFSNLSAGVTRSVGRLNADGSFDPSFRGDANSSISRILSGPNGEIYVSGDFTQYGGVVRNRIARLNQDGSLDPTFSPNFGTSYVQIAAVQPDGKLIVNGTFTNIGGIARQKVARLFPDGTVDLSFDAGTGTNNSTIYKGIVQPDGKILLGGQFNSYNGMPCRGIVRINSDGNIDDQFDQQLPGTSSNIVFDLALSPEGKIYAAGDIGNAETVYRLNTNGTLDTTFDTGHGQGVSGGQVYRVLLQSDGRVVVGGGFDSFIVRNVMYQAHGLFRFNSDGSADANFTPGVSGGGGQTVWALSQQPDGRILIGGVFTDISSSQRTGGIGRLNLDGSVDTSFVGFMGTLSTISNFVIAPDDKILIAGDFGTLGTSRHEHAARLNADGTVDESFQLDSAVNMPVSDFAIRPDGKILIGGSSGGFFPPYSKGMWRVNADGSLDNSFDAQISDQSSVLSVTLQQDGKILIGGNFTTVNGSSRPALARLNQNGSLDTAFNASMAGTVRAVAVQSDGKILVGGHLNIIGSQVQNFARLNTDGSVDEGFAIGTSAGDEVFSVLQLPDERLYVAGAFRNFNGTPRNNLVRLLPNGLIDPSFSQPRLSGITTFSAAVQSDGKVLVGGEGDAAIDASPRQKVLRLLADGSIDYSYDVNGVINRGSAGRAFKVGLQSNGNVIAAGQFDTINGVQRAGLARLLQSDRPTPPNFDFDGNGTSDIAVFRPGNGVWYRRVSFSTVTRSAQWGLSTDKIVPADYDGDYLTDLAVFRPANGSWYWINSSDNSVSSVQFGTTGDVPVPGDYDGDNRADLAVYRPSTGIWYRTNSSDGSFHAFQFGTSEDRPTVGDFDGDDLADIAVYRPSSGIWYRINSSDGSFSGEQFGIAEDITTPADFDGDRRTDLAVFRPSSGFWYIRGSSGGSFTATQFGTTGDVPVAGDFDGDERADLAVFRSANGVWYRTESSSGAFVALQFGTNGDVPVETAYTH